MPNRALIVAIEHYPKSGDLAQHLDHVNERATDFYAWAIDKTKKKIEPADIFVCADGGTFPSLPTANRFATNREAIVDALAALVAAGQDQTPELHVFYSGHGYCFQESLEKHAIDVLVASDFESAALSGTKCLKLQEIQEKLFFILGGVQHYYFIDACRTRINDGEIDPIGLGRKLGKRAQQGQPMQYTLFSTAFGLPADINSEFAPALIDGLDGKGTAKGTTPAGALWVQFPLLRTYVQKRLKDQTVDANNESGGEGLIVQIDPIPTYTCTINVDGAAPADTFEARISVSGNPAFSQTTQFHGSQGKVTFNPGNFDLGVFEMNQPLKRLDPPDTTRLEFFDDLTVSFRRVGGSARAARSFAPPAPTTAAINMAPMADVRASVVNLNTGEVREMSGGSAGTLTPGDYAVTVSERGIPIRRDVQTLEPGGEVNIGTAPWDPIRASIVTAVNGDPSRKVVAFSETLGDIGNPDLGLWLSLMGASHILRDPGTFSKLQNLALDPVTQHGPNSAAVYVLAAMPGDARLAVTVGHDVRTARPVPQLTGVFQATVPATPGSQLVTIGLGKDDERTFASFALPNRLTFIVLSPGTRDQLRINQFLLPMFHLLPHLPPFVEDKLKDDRRPLRVIRTAYLFQAQFARNSEIRPVEPEDQITWNELLYGKWLDPVMSLVACYEILRRGKDGDKAVVRDVVVPNLERFFPDIPDTAAVADMLGLPRPMPHAPPIFKEGLLAFPDWENHLPLTADKLDFNYIWTTWRRARRS